VQQQDQQQQQQDQQQQQPRVVVLVTGCTEGSLGAALVRAFHAAGARVFATARRLETMDGLPSDVGRVRLDVTDDAQCAEAVAAVLEATSGRLDVLVNNAGIALPGALLEAPVADLRATLETNTVAPMVLARAAVPAMAKRGGGVIVNINSIYADVWSPFHGAYCMSKHALRVVSDTLRLELAPYGVKVLDVALGYTATPLLGKGTARLAAQAEARANASGPRAVPAAAAAAATTTAPPPAGAYAAALRGQALLGACAAPVDRVAKAIVAAALRPNGPPCTLRVGAGAGIARLLACWAPAWVLSIAYALMLGLWPPQLLPPMLIRLVAWLFKRGMSKQC
jgi:NAD(P)-dependent dehydrogenase (short-subunit alcohol dehydrogenase family)